MRSNRSSYSAAPAGSHKVLTQKPRPKRPKKEWNQLLLMLFFVVLPVIGLLAIFFQPVRYIFMAAAVACIALMWLVHAFLFPGRMILTAIYGLLLVFTLVTALTANSSSQIKRQQQANLFAQMTPVPTSTPFITQYTGDTVGMHNGIADGLTGIQGVGFSGGSGDQSVEDLGVTETGANEYVPVTKTDSEIALENFMEKWRKAIIADMVGYTPTAWRKAQGESAQQQLFWKFAQRPLEDWRQMSAPSGTDTSTARTITIEADVNYGGEMRTYQYDAIVLNENGKWYVDPDSLSSGILKTASPPTPDPNMTPTPSPEPTPTPKPSAKTKRYYNKDGGRKYHAEKECYTVDKKSLPLASFNYGDLGKKPYNRLEPCDKCHAPE